MTKTVRELAEYLGGTVIGNGDTVIEDIRGLAEAGKEHITFAVDPYLEYLPQVHAGAVMVEKEVPCGDNTLVIVENPRMAFSRLLVLFHPRQSVAQGIHPTVVQGDHVTMGANVSIMAYAVLGSNIRIGDDCIIYPNVYIGDNVVIGSGTVIYPGAVIHENTVLGERDCIRAHAVIGGEGFGFATKDGKHTRIPQIGNVVIGDDVEIGACTTIDNATLGSTKVARGTKIDNLVHLGHNCEIGEDCFIIAQTGLAGSTIAGNHVIFAGQSATKGHISICSDTVFAGRSGITKNITEPGIYGGFPVRPHMEWTRQEAYLKHLPELTRKVKALEKKLAELEKK